jgi:hypothetical protein
VSFDQYGRSMKLGGCTQVAGRIGHRAPAPDRIGDVQHPPCIAPSAACASATTTSISRLAPGGRRPPPLWAIEVLQEFLRSRGRNMLEVADQLENERQKRITSQLGL